MPIVCTHPATTTGHDGFPSTVSQGGDPFLVIDGHPVILVGQEFVPHRNSEGAVHTPVLASGSSYVTVNGIPVGLVGSALNCGDTVATSATPLFTIEE